MNATAGCVTRSRLFVEPHAIDPGVRYAMTFAPDGDPVSLTAVDGGPSGLKLDVAHQFRLVDPEPTDEYLEWRVSTVAYVYALLDAGDHELLAYHWQPDPNDEGPDHPHLHVRTTLPAQVQMGKTREIHVGKLHAPTGRVSLEAVVRMLLVELDIKPLHGDWRAVLDRAELRFREVRRQLP